MKTKKNDIWEKWLCGYKARSKVFVLYFLVTAMFHKGHGYSRCLLQDIAHIFINRRVYTYIAP